MFPIDFCHIPVSIIKRSAGRSAVAAAAYRSGTKLINEWDGMTHDYTRKGGIVHAEIMLPAHAPPEFADRSILWNSVEQIEKARDSQLAREIGGQKQRISLARIFATDPDLFVLDEPTTGMDEESRNEFYRLLRHSAHVHGKSVLMITHDHEDIKQYADRQIRLVRKEDSQWRCFHMNS